MGLGEGSCGVSALSDIDMNRLPQEPVNLKEENIFIIYDNSEDNSMTNQLNLEQADDVDRLGNTKGNEDRPDNIESNGDRPDNIEGDGDRPGNVESNTDLETNVLNKMKENKIAKNKSKKAKELNTNIENQLLEKLIGGSNEGLLAISHALEAVAQSNNNISNSIDKLTQVVKDKIDNV